MTDAIPHGIIPTMNFCTKQLCRNRLTACASSQSYFSSIKTRCFKSKKNTPPSATKKFTNRSFLFIWNRQASHLSKEEIGTHGNDGQNNRMTKMKKETIPIGSKQQTEITAGYIKSCRRSWASYYWSLRGPSKHDLETQVFQQAFNWKKRHEFRKDSHVGRCLPSSC